MELSIELQDFILENGVLILSEDDYNRISYKINISLLKSQYDNSFIKELDTISKMYEFAVFPGNYKFDVGFFVDGLIQNVINTKYSKEYNFVFDNLNCKEKDILVKISSLKFNKKGE